MIRSTFTFYLFLFWLKISVGPIQGRDRCGIKGGLHSPLPGQANLEMKLFRMLSACGLLGLSL